MKPKTIVKSIRFNQFELDRCNWLKNNNFNADLIIRKAFNEYFEKHFVNYKKEEDNILPF